MINKNSHGAASLILVILFSIIISIVTISFIRLTIEEESASLSAELSSRALFAAEAGYGDALRALEDGIRGATLNGDNCNPPSGYTSLVSADFDAEYTCQLIDVNPARYTARADQANTTFRVPLNPSSGIIDRIGIRWHTNGLDGVVGTSTTLRTAGSTDLLTAPDWAAAQYPAMMRISLARAHKSPSPSTNNPVSLNDNQITFFLSPNTGNPASPTTVSMNPIDASYPDATVIEATCNPSTASDDYVCEAYFNGLEPLLFDYVLQATNIYQPASFEVVMLDVGGSELNYDEVQAIIDVTARSGDVYRRVQKIVDLVDPHLLPFAGLVSTEKICKDFTVGPLATDYTGIAGTSCTSP